ncbi:hypothetical protein E1212_01260 [Jiangella ureilytica]|uniref:Uncharacterized protein n=2 Tax=Jiangella TaxID=281472 RepID=A0A4R4S1Q1_9ACTN|nr:hypothetical protein [Jiangella ureilytica]TDC56630.1 hypothetical protein E1212_01260 [Jiangella ureilytica]
MTIGYGPVGSVLNEQPPSGHQRARHHGDGLSAPRPARLAVTTPPGYPEPDSNRHALVGSMVYEVVYDDPHGNPMLAFADGQWFDVTSFAPRPVSVRHALRRDPAWSGAVVQTICLWMRSNPNHERSFDLATELALAVGELARQRR